MEQEAELDEFFAFLLEVGLLLGVIDPFGGKCMLLLHLFPWGTLLGNASLVLSLFMVAFTGCSFFTSMYSLRSAVLKESSNESSFFMRIALRLVPLTYNLYVW